MCLWINIRRNYIFVKYHFAERGGLSQLWYKVEKFTSTCSRCDRSFAAMTRTIEYPSRTSFGQEGDPHVPMDSSRFCIYCDADTEIADDTPFDDGGENAPRIMADGGGIDQIR